MKLLLQLQMLCPLTWHLVDDVISLTKHDYETKILPIQKDQRTSCFGNSVNAVCMSHHGIGDSHVGSDSKIYAPI